MNVDLQVYVGWQGAHLNGSSLGRIQTHCVGGSLFSRTYSCVSVTRARMVWKAGGVREARMIWATAVPDSWRTQMPAVRILADHMLIKDGAISALTTKKKVCRVSIEIAVCKEMISKKSVLQS